MISVVIPAFNEEKNISAALSSLTKQTYKKKFEVIVVDNNSTDNTSMIVKKFKSSLPRGLMSIRLFVEKSQGRGYAKAKGAKEANGEILAYLDADTRATPSWLYQIDAAFKNQSVVAVTGPWRVYDLPAGFTKSFLHHFQEAGQLPYRILFGHFWLNGMNMAFRASTYKKAGGFDTRLNVHDDIDLTHRLRAYGKIAYNPKMIVKTSGRRYKHGLLKGLMSYHKGTLNFLLGKRADLEDIR